MLFNSLEFIFLFLPASLGLYGLLVRRHREMALWFLALASIAFYSWWKVENTPLLIGSMLGNFLIGRYIESGRSARASRTALIAGIVANLSALAFFKYANFIAANLNAFAHLNLPTQHIDLPLGISFFTFVQIAYLIDVHRRQASEYRLSHYCLFVSYFPHLLAGPVLHHSDVMPQFMDAKTGPTAEKFAQGLTLFAIGLFKKVVIADTVAVWADQAFSIAAKGGSLSTLDAWCGALCYTFQIYFDFSGYSDMALGISLMFGIRIPINFRSPYKAASIVDFWRRWHITLSRFLRDYLYITLGGNRKGAVRRHLNLLVTMVLGGLWHGAAWTFVAWGALHGLLLVLNHGWTAVQSGFQRLTGFSRPLLSPIEARIMTFGAVVCAWVLFRAPDLGTAARILEAMFSVDLSFALPARSIDVLGDNLAGLLRDVGIYYTYDSVFGSQINALRFHPPVSFRTADVIFNVLNAPWIWVTLCAAVCWLFPSSNELISTDLAQAESAARKWKPGLAWSAVVATALTVSLGMLATMSTFLYWQF